LLDIVLNITSPHPVSQSIIAVIFQFTDGISNILTHQLVALNSATVTAQVAPFTEVTHVELVKYHAPFVKSQVSVGIDRTTAQVCQFTLCTGACVSIAHFNTDALIVLALVDVHVVASLALIDEYVVLLSNPCPMNCQ
jgi:hypothetical protein